MGAPCVSARSGFWLVYLWLDLSVDSYCMLIITGLISARARISRARDHYLPPPRDFRTRLG